MRAVPDRTDIPLGWPLVIFGLVGPIAGGLAMLGLSLIFFDLIPFDVLLGTPMGGLYRHNLWNYTGEGLSVVLMASHIVGGLPALLAGALCFQVWRRGRHPLLWSPWIGLGIGLCLSGVGFLPFLELHRDLLGLTGMLVMPIGCSAAAALCAWMAFHRRPLAAATRRLD